jgi:type VI secretion system protein ImpH
MEAGERARPDDLTLLARLARSPHTHHIFHALRIIEAAHPESPRLGTSRRPSQDPVRLGQEAELAFPPSTIAKFTPSKGGKPAKLVNRAFGLFGSNGPLPLHLTEYARDRVRNHRDTTFIAFADMLTHRLMTLFYRAWRSGQPAPSFDRPDTDQFERKVAAISGHDGEALRRRDAMPDLAKRYFAGHLAAGNKTAEGLNAMLAAFFEVPVRMVEFVGSWLDLEPDDRWQLGAPARLGMTTSIGTRVWTRAAKFRIVVGPVGLKDYKRFLPGQGRIEQLEAIVRNHVGDRLDWDVNVVLKGNEVPRSALGSGAALGHTTWLGVRRDRGTDATDLVLMPSSVRRRAQARHDRNRETMAARSVGSKEYRG